MKPALGAEAGLDRRWFVVWGVAVLPVCADFQRRRQRSATTAHRALPLCEWPVLDMPWSTARSNAASAVLRRCGGARTGGCGRPRRVVCEGLRFCRFLEVSVEEEAPLANHNAQSPVSV